MLDPLGDARFVWPFLAAFLLGYLLGSIPFGLVLTRLAGLGDIRRIGSGNIGATNVLRTGRKGLAALTLLLDGAKGALPVLVAGTMFSRDLAICVGSGALLGHLLPLFLLRLSKQGRVGAIREILLLVFGLTVLLLSKGALGVAGGLLLITSAWFAWGGKGVATGLGILLAIAPYLGVLSCLAWLATAALTRYSSLSALVAFLVAPIAGRLLTHTEIGGSFVSDPQLVEFTSFIAALVIVRHRDNIVRLVKGEESRIGAKKPGRSNGEKP